MLSLALSVVEGVGEGLQSAQQPFAPTLGKS